MGQGKRPAPRLKPIVRLVVLVCVLALLWQIPYRGWMPLPPRDLALPPPQMPTMPALPPPTPLAPEQVEALTTLYTFEAIDDGATPDGELLAGADGSYYGVATEGGEHKLGTVFRMAPDGAVRVLHAFAGGAEGAYPVAGLVQDAQGNLLGVTANCRNPQPSPVRGKVFRLAPDGALTILHSFSGGTDTDCPNTALARGADGAYYGTTAARAWQASGPGSIFRITADGAYTVLRSYPADTHTREFPSGRLLAGADGALYGETRQPEPEYRIADCPVTACNFYAMNHLPTGTVFRITPQGELSTLHVFGPRLEEGEYPSGGLAAGPDGLLYGSTDCDEAGGRTVFRISRSGDFSSLGSLHQAGCLDSGLTPASDGSFYGVANNGLPGAQLFRLGTGSAYSLLHSFPGEWLRASRLVPGADGSFYGTTSRGGVAGHGTLFRLTPSGSLDSLHMFGLGASDGLYPDAPLVEGEDGMFYGITAGGPCGTLFRLTAAGQISTLYRFACDNAPPSLLLRGRDGAFYGAQERGGPLGYGSLFRFASGTLTTLHALAGGGEGALPHVLLQGSDGNLYGTTIGSPHTGDPSGQGHPPMVYGTVFRLSPSGVFTTLHQFSGGDDSVPDVLLQGGDGNLYGTTGSQWSLEPGRSKGSVFRIGPDGAFTSLHTFTGDDGANPSALVYGADGKLYGTTRYGPRGGGTVFQLTAAGALTTLYWFRDGDNPGSLVVARDGGFYGTTENTGNDTPGRVFHVGTDGSLTVLHAFYPAGREGYDPINLLQASDGNLYGINKFNPTLFRIAPDGAMRILHSFGPSLARINDALRISPLIEGRDGKLYGATVNGGDTRSGTVFRIDPKN